MRLLNVHTLEFRQHLRPTTVPRYAIASHRWGSEEATLEEVERKLDSDKAKAGYKKVQGFVEFVRKHLEHVDWIWIDTCCINKKDGPELAQAINSMYNWYHNAEVCLAYLSDVEIRDDLGSFKDSEWFRRGWTLQELVAPRTVVFLTRAWEVIGYKGSTGRGKSGVGLNSGTSLTASLVAATGIPTCVLEDSEDSKEITVKERLEWAACRETTLEEDMSYCLLGMLNVSMPVIYGEGGKRARSRLLEEVERAHKEHKQQYYATLLPQPQPNDLEDIVDWLSAPNPWTNHALARQRHESQTGLWLLESEQYQSWKNGPPGHIWLSGKAGCGKTILCSSVIEDVKARCLETTDTGYAAFYFSFTDKSKQTYSDFLRSLVAQLLRVDDGLLMLRQAYRMRNRTVPSAFELKAILQASIKSYGKVFVLLDALDECPEADTGDARQEVLRFLEDLAAEAPNVRVFATSREMLDIAASMRLIDAELIAATTDLVDGDISKYVSIEVARDSRLRRLNPALKAEIAGVMSRKADGMFRWAFCQLQELKKLKSTKPSHIREVLRALPATLDETYERILGGIEERYRNDALILLNWIAYAHSPRTLLELSEAVVISLEDDTVDADDRGSPEDTLEILAGLIAVYEDEDEDDKDSYGGDEGSDKTTDQQQAANSDCDLDLDHQTPLSSDAESLRPIKRARMNSPAESQALARSRVRLAHYSVKEYLESERISQSSVKQYSLNDALGHRLLAQSCIVYLICYSRTVRKTSKPSDISAFPMLGYAAEFWFHHAALQQTGDVDREISLLTSDDARLDWIRVHDPDRPNKYRGFASAGDIAPALYYAAVVGLSTVVEELLSLGCDVNAQTRNAIKDTALHAASSFGHENVVAILINSGADVNAQNEKYGSALQDASFFGQNNVVATLINRGADVNAQSGHYGSALQAASEFGYDEVVALLIDKGADVNAQGGDYGSALQIASHFRHKNVVALLIDKGADVNAQGGPFGSALQAASLSDREDIVALLIDKGADVNVQGGRFGSALRAALWYNRRNVVDTLRNAGAVPELH